MQSRHLVKVNNAQMRRQWKKQVEIKAIHVCWWAFCNLRCDQKNALVLLQLGWIKVGTEIIMKENLKWHAAQICSQAITREKQDLCFSWRENRIFVLPWLMYHSKHFTKEMYSLSYLPCVSIIFNYTIKAEQFLHASKREFSPTLHWTGWLD